MGNYKWGIIGTGMIARKMAEAISLIDNAEVSAVLSRTNENAEKFAQQYTIQHTYTNLEEFASSPEFDIAYVATPHNKHKNETIACINAGKAVLCEKPMGVNLSEVEEMIKLAREKDVFLMEAFWTYYFPAMQKAKELVESGEIGKPIMIDAKFCFAGEYDPVDRKFNPELAGGALLDIGLYCITVPQMFFNDNPVEITGMAAKCETGVDESSSYILKYTGNRLATLTSSFKTACHNDAWIFGEKGMIRIPMFWQPDDVYLIKDGKEKKFTFERFGNGYTYEAIELMKYLDANKKESDIFNFQNSIDLIKIMDKLRTDWDMKYPFESVPTNRKGL